MVVKKKKEKKPEESQIQKLARWIKIRCGGGNYTLDEITESYRELMKYNGHDPNHPPVGLDLVEETLRTLLAAE